MGMGDGGRLMIKEHLLCIEQMPCPLFDFSSRHGYSCNKLHQVQWRHEMGHRGTPLLSRRLCPHHPSDRRRKLQKSGGHFQNISEFSPSETHFNISAPHNFLILCQGATTVQVCQLFFPWLWQLQTCRNSYNSVEQICRIPCKILQILMPVIIQSHSDTLPPSLSLL